MCDQMEKIHGNFKNEAQISNSFRAPNALYVLKRNLDTIMLYINNRMHDLLLSVFL